METADLLFPSDQFVLKSLTSTLDGESHAVTYRAYEHLTYVSRPVDAAYQSLDILVPESIDGVPFDATDAPVFFMIGVGGFMSENNYHRTPLMPPPPPAGAEATPSPAGPPLLPLPGLGGMAGADAYIELALAQGYVVVRPGCRGRDCQRSDGTYFGKAPAAIVDLKAAVRYLRHNADRIPGNLERILCSGGSAGGALSCLLAASGNAPDYEPYLEALGAARERDDVFASASFSPIVNLENSDAAYEWEFGSIPCGERSFGPFRLTPGLVDQTLSGALRAQFVEYQDALALPVRNGSGVLTADNLETHLLETYLFPEAERYFATLDPQVLENYLVLRPWIHYDGVKVSFTFRDYALYVQRGKGLPAFDDFALEMAEPDLFGSATAAARHFTQFSIEHGGCGGALTDELRTAIRLMNPMCFLQAENPGCAPHWWIRHGCVDNSTALPIVTNMADALAAIGKDVNVRLIWDGGHCDDDDPVGMLTWMKSLD